MTKSIVYYTLLKLKDIEETYVVGKTSWLLFPTFKKLFIWGQQLQQSKMKANLLKKIVSRLWGAGKFCEFHDLNKKSIFKFGWLPSGDT